MEGSSFLFTKEVMKEQNCDLEMTNAKGSFLLVLEYQNDKGECVADPIRWPLQSKTLEEARTEANMILMFERNTARSPSGTSYVRAAINQVGDSEHCVVQMVLVI